MSMAGSLEMLNSANAADGRKEDKKEKEKPNKNI